MIYEKDLAKPDKTGFKDIARIDTILTYLYVGKEIEYKGYTYKMDADFNPYVVMYGDEENVPIFRNDIFWNILIDMVFNLTEEEYEKILLEVAVIKTLN